MGHLVTLIFGLLFSHFLFDFSLQSDTMAINKNSDANTDLQKFVPSWYWLVSHAFLHGGGVLIVTNSVWLALAEFMSHFFIDLGKCKKLYSIHVDQALHLACKILWIILIYAI